MDLETCPWNPLSCSKAKFMFKFKSNAENSYTLLVTDLINIYQEALICEDILQRSKRLNPRIEAPTASLVKQIESCLYCQVGLTYNHSPGSSKRLSLSAEAKLFGTPFKWCFDLDACEDEMFFQHVTRPSLGIIMELQSQREALIKLISAKDKEINDYKEQGAVVSRKHIATAPFKLKEFESNLHLDNQSLRQFDKAFLSKQSQTLYQTVSKQLLSPNTSDDRTEPIDKRGSIVKKSPPKKPSLSAWVTMDTSYSQDTELEQREKLQRKLAAEKSRDVTRKNTRKRGLF